jgi:hypothetical protein
MHIKKILAYDVYAKTIGTVRYQYVSKLLNQSVDPETLLLNSLDCSQQAVFTSPQKRAVSCIKKDSTSSISTYPALNEIAFSLQEFCNEKDFLRDGSSAVRKAFVQAFIEDKLHTSHEVLQTELASIFELSKQAKPPLCISHTFRMKLLEIYANIGKSLFQNPAIIQKYIDYNKHLYEFGEIIEI